MNDKVAEKIEEKEETQSELDQAFVTEEQRVLDPTLLNKSLLDRMPTPTGWRILVLPYRGKGVTEGGIQLVKETMDRESLSTVVAYVLKVGPLAYKDEGKFGNPDNPWCKEGDWICIGRYAGSRFSLEDMEVRVINDDEVIATLLDPEDIKHI